MGCKVKVGAMKTFFKKNYICAIFILVFCLVSISFLFVKNVRSQNTALSEFNEAYKQYTLSLEDYQRKHSEYVLAKSQYESFQTLKSQSEAIEATKQMLTARNTVLVSYLKAMQIRLNNAIGVELTDKTEIGILIDEEINWYESQNLTIPSAETFEELEAESKDGEERYQSTINISYRTLSYVSFGKVEDFHERLVETFTALKNKIEEIKLEERENYKLSDSKLLAIDRWIIESENRVTRSEEQKQQAEESLLELSTDTNIRSNDYNAIVAELEQSRQYMKESAAFIKEIIREIKTEQ